MFDAKEIQALATLAARAPKSPVEELWLARFIQKCQFLAQMQQEQGRGQKQEKEQEQKKGQEEEGE